MATFRDIDLEHLSDILKTRHGKANTLGADGSPAEEPFSLSSMVFSEDLMFQAPNIDDLNTPLYGDQDVGGGSVGTRMVKVRLHPLVVSGKGGNSSIQTFVAVSGPPKSDSVRDIEDVRIKHLIPPAYSPGRRTAYENDINRRGFELALFPSKDVGGALEADDSRGPISQFADPSAVYGVGSDGTWSVDYSNGIIRFDTAPLNGSTGVMNPNNVYGDIAGATEDVNSGGRITMFATFYQYVGLSLDGYEEAKLVTVGDGINSLGRFNSSNEGGIHDAVAYVSSNGYGGSVFIKPGDYVFNGSVTVPYNVKLVGTSRRVNITKPNGEPAFIIDGNNSSIEGITILSSGVSSDNEPAIKFTTTANTGLVGTTRTVEDIYIKNNILYSTSDAYGIGITSGHSDAVFKNITIEDNHFVCAYDDSNNSTIHIGEMDAGANDASVYNLKINRNIFDGDVNYKSISVLVDGSCFSDINELYITDGYAEELSDIVVNNSLSCNNININNNKYFNEIVAHTTAQNNTKIDNNYCRRININGTTTSMVVANNTVEESISVIGGSNTNAVILDNIVDGSIDLGTMSQVVIDSNRFETFVISGRPQNVTISNNFIGSASIEQNSGTNNKLIIHGNNFSSTFSVTNQNITNSEISGNIFWSTVSFTPFEVVQFCNNDIYDTTTFLAISFTVIDSNVFQYSVAMSGRPQDVVFSNNILFYDLTVDYVGGSASRLTISGNQFIDAVTFVNNAATISVVGNLFEYTADFTDCYYLNFCDNHMSDAVTFGVLYGAVIDGNYSLSSISVSGRPTDVIISSNVMTTLSFTQNTNTYDEMIIANNDFSGAVTFDNQNITNSVISGNRFGSSVTLTLLSGSGVYNNNIGGTTALSGMISSKLNNNIMATVNVSTYRLLESEISNNKMTSLSVSQNSATNDQLIISNNNVTTTVSFTNQNITNSVITENRFESTVALTDFDTNEFNNNIISGTTTFGSITNSSVNGNTMSAATISDLTYSRISNNSFSGAVSITPTGSSYASYSVISDNIFSSTFTCDNGSNYGPKTCEFVGNVCVDNVEFGKCLDTCISDNCFDLATTTIYSLERSSFSNNVQSYSDGSDGVVLGSVADFSTISGNVLYHDLDIDGYIKNSNISNNIVRGYFDMAGTVLSTVIVGNHVVGMSFASTVTECEFSGNHCYQFSVTGAMTSTTVSGNSFVGPVLLHNVDNSLWSGNRHDQTFGILCNVAATAAASEFVFNGNVCTGDVSIKHGASYLASATASIVNCNISGNTFLSTLQIGYDSTDQHLWNRSIFSNNTGVGGWTFYTSDDDNCNDIIITGNNVGAALTFTIGAGTMDSPPIGSDSAIIALNFFVSYVGITFDDTKSLGWGDGDSGSIIHTNR